MDFELRESKFIKEGIRRKTVYKGYCDNCGDIVWKTKHDWQSHKRRFCGKECFFEFRKKTKRQKAASLTIACSTCGNPTKKARSELRRSKSGNVFCSLSCSTAYNNTIYRSGDNNPHWAGGQSSYRTRALKHYGTECQNIDCELRCCSLEVPEAMLDVHHIDDDRNNNHINNLVVLCIYCHGLISRGIKKLEDMNIKRG